MPNSQTQEKELQEKEEERPESGINPIAGSVWRLVELTAD